MDIYSGLVISGGSPLDSAGSTVEVFIPSTGQHCQLPDMPGDPRYGHTMEDLMVCGGGGSTGRSCLSLTDGTWETTTTLVERR